MSACLTSRKRNGDDIDRICGRRQCGESSDGWEYALRHKGVSYLHLDWVTRQQLDQMDFKKNIMINRFFKKVRDAEVEGNGDIMFVDSENYLVDIILDCVDAVIEVNPDLYITGWRMLPPESVLPEGAEIYNLPRPWRERLGVPDTTPKAMKQESALNDLAGENPYMCFEKDISQYYPKDESHPTPTADGSVFRYERVFLVKWMGLGIAEATWERACDIGVSRGVRSSRTGRWQDSAVFRVQHHSLAHSGGVRRLPARELSLSNPHSPLTSSHVRYERQCGQCPYRLHHARRRPDGEEVEARPPAEGSRHTAPHAPASQLHRPEPAGGGQGYLNPAGMSHSGGEGERVQAAPGRHLATHSEHRDGAEQLSPAGHRDLLRLCAEQSQSVGERKVLRRHQAASQQAEGLGEQDLPRAGRVGERAALKCRIAKEKPQMAAFQKACYQWLSKYAQLHHDVSLTDRDVRMLVGGEFDTESETPQVQSETPGMAEPEIAKISPYPPKVHSDKVYASEFDFDATLDYCSGFGPIGTCGLFTETPCSSETPDRTVVFQSLDKKPMGSLVLNEGATAEKGKNETRLPPVIAAPLEEKVECVYVQPVQLAEIRAIRAAGVDVSVGMNDIMKTVVYDDRSIDPAGYALRNTVVAVMDNTVATFNALKANAAVLKKNDRVAIEQEEALNVLPVSLSVLNTRRAFEFNPGVVGVEKASEEKVEEKPEEKEEEKVEEKPEEMEVKVKEEEKPVRATVPSTKMIIANRAKFKAFEESMARALLTVDDLMHVLFRPSKLNAPIALLPPPPSLPMNDSFEPYTESPTYKDGLKLRPYQVESLNWMVGKWRNKEGMILGDEMGLGKTIQVISLLHHFIYTEHQEGPYLVISPLSTLKNWLREFATWTSIRVCFYHSEGKGKDERALIRHFNWYFKGLPARSLYKFNVLLTTYEVVMKDWALLGDIQWTGVVMDEAHRMRNNNCKFIQFVSNIKTAHKLLLTGTPLQNNTGELWPLLNFIDVKEAGSLERFKAAFGDLRSAEQVEKLRELLRSCMLRRVKEDVEKSIPRKQETIVEVELTMTQKQYYKAMYDKNRSFLYKGCKKADIPSLMHVEMQLRKVCNHPFLIKARNGRSDDR